MVDPIMKAAQSAVDHEHSDVWAAFYPAAHAFAVGLAEDWPPLASDHTADCIAALSPQVAWDYNMTLAARAVELYRQGDHDLRGLSGQTKANIRNAASALNGTGPGNGPKVNAFARNIRGDWSVVCVDRHMLDAAGFDPKKSTTKTRAEVARRVTVAARRFDTEPATMQALIWGWWRFNKGYSTYYHGGTI